MANRHVLPLNIPLEQTLYVRHQHRPNCDGSNAQLAQEMLRDFTPCFGRHRCLSTSDRRGSVRQKCHALAPRAHMCPGQIYISEMTLTVPTVISLSFHGQHEAHSLPLCYTGKSASEWSLNVVTRMSHLKLFHCSE